MRIDPARVASLRYLDGADDFRIRDNQARACQAAAQLVLLGSSGLDPCAVAYLPVEICITRTDNVCDAGREVAEWQGRRCGKGSDVS